MKNKITTTVTSIRRLDPVRSRYEDVFVLEKFMNYYLEDEQGKHFLFTTPYNECEFKRFGGGINYDAVISGTKTKKDDLLREVFEKLCATVSDIYKSRKANAAA